MVACRGCRAAYREIDSLLRAAGSVADLPQPSVSADLAGSNRPAASQPDGSELRVRVLLAAAALAATVLLGVIYRSGVTEESLGPTAEPQISSFSFEESAVGATHGQVLSRATDEALSRFTFEQAPGPVGL